MIKRKYLFKILSAFLLFLSFNDTHSQNKVDSLKYLKNKYVVSFIPSRSPNSYGIQIGLIGSEVICGYPYYKVSNGFNFQVFGQGILWMFYPIVYKNIDSASIIKMPIDTLIKYDRLRSIHNGIMFSSFGAIDTKVNGITMSLFYGQGNSINGIASNLIRNKFNVVNGLEIGLINESRNVKGLQLGLINVTNNLNGFQIGLWNVNNKRTLPLINWNFKNKN